MIRPLPYSAPMARAAWLGVKSQTRRVVKPQPYEWQTHVPNSGRVAEIIHPDGSQEAAICPYGDPGTFAWIREPFRIPKDCEGLLPRQLPADCSIWYEADGDPPEGYGPVKKEWFMPRALHRQSAQIIDVRVERVQEISEEDAEAEGTPKPPRSVGSTASAHFKTVWNHINARRGYGWDANPWVWVLELEHHRCPVWELEGTA